MAYYCKTRLLFLIKRERKKMYIYTYIYTHICFALAWWLPTILCITATSYIAVSSPVLQHHLLQFLMFHECPPLSLVLLLNCLLGGSHRRLRVYISAINRVVAAFGRVIASAQINRRRNPRQSRKYRTVLIQMGQFSNTECWSWSGYRRN
jgi:hypothetical protein